MQEVDETHIGVILGVITSLAWLGGMWRFFSLNIKVYSALVFVFFFFFLLGSAFGWLWNRGFVEGSMIYRAILFLGVLVVVGIFFLLWIFFDVVKAVLLVS